jgi:hypothetical protein
MPDREKERERKTEGKENILLGEYLKEMAGEV